MMRAIKRCLSLISIPMLCAFLLFPAPGNAEVRPDKAKVEKILTDLSAVSQTLSYIIRHDSFFNNPSGRNRLDIVDYFHASAEDFKSFYSGNSADVLSLSRECENMLVALDHLSYIFSGYRNPSGLVFKKYRECLEAVYGLVFYLEKGGAEIEHFPVHQFRHFQRRPENWPKEDGPNQGDLETIRYYFRIYLKREPQYYEEQQLLDKYIDGRASHEEIKESLKNSEEAKRKFVEEMFRRYFFRFPGKEELVMRLKEFENGIAREDMEKEVARSRQAAEAFASAVYRIYLNRKITDKELEEYVATIMNGICYEDIKLDILDKRK
jgi:hypothetical protein